MTTIEWTDQTWNPVTGCSKVSAGCDHCYAEAFTARRAGSPGWIEEHRPWTPENAEHNVRLWPARLDQPRKWRKPCMVFVNSMSDLFHPRVPGEYIERVFAVMADCPQHTFQILTKRPKRMASWCRKYQPEPLPNVWLGTSIESREWIGRADALRDTPAAVRFISAEPLLESLIEWMFCATCEEPDPRCEECEGVGAWPLQGFSLDLHDIDWLIVGGESGAGHRPIRAEWVRELRDLCEYADTAFFFKQWGGIRPKSGGRELDGRTWDEYPNRVGELA